MLNLFLVTSLIVGATACRTPTSPAVSEHSDAPPKPGYFIGCGPSEGECKNSCEDRNGWGEIDEKQCIESQAPYACYCPSVKVEPVVEPQGQFVGCAPSEGECRMSCDERNGLWALNPERCPDRRSPYACYCP